MGCSWVVRDWKFPRAVPLTVLTLCALVLFFGAWAKLSAYQAHSSHDPISSAKLWQDGDELGLEYFSQSVGQQPYALLCRSLFLLRLLLFFAGVQRGPAVEFQKPQSIQRLALFGLHRFLRPPPITRF
jgi:hypothetical protein